jgi:uncharacterized membrane protein
LPNGCRAGSVHPFSIFLHTAAFVACFEAWLLGEARLEDMLLWLTTIVSLEAIYIGLFLQNSSNHGDANEQQAAEDYRTNVEAERRVERLEIELARIESEKLDAILKLLVKPAIGHRKQSTPARRKTKTSRK